MKKTLANLFIGSAIIVFGTTASLAGPFDDLGCPPGCDGIYPNCGPCEDPAIPLDGGVSLIIAAGVGFAGKKALEYRKKKKADTL